ncbi:hypothetical protein AUK22_10020, partial [bacterium CG2_30_54_10]
SGISGSKDRFVLLFSHGNAGNLVHRFPKILELASLPLDIFVYDYRGFGQSDGSPSVPGAIIDGEAALAWLTKEKKIPMDRIILYGESLGSGITTALASPRLDKIAGIVIESGFRSLSCRASKRIPIIGPLILSQDLPNTTILSLYKGPFFVIHSKADGVIPFEDGEALFAACPSTRKTFLKLEGVGHNDAVWKLPDYLPAWRVFLESAGSRRRADPAGSSFDK